MIRVDDLPAQFRPLSRPSWLTPNVWPFETFGIEVDGTQLAVTETGGGPPLLFVHVGAWSFLWRDLVLQLAPDFRCIFFDAPGNGRSQRKPEVPLTLESASRAVEAVIAALDLRHLTVIAHDLGGPAAMAAIASAPERIRGIVAMNAFGWRPSGAALRGMLWLMGRPVMREIDVLTGFLPRISASSFGVGKHYDAASRSAFLAGMPSSGRRAFHDYMHDAARCDAFYRRVQRAVAGPLARKPLLTVFGERNDPFGFQDEWRRLFPHARKVVVARGNHFPMCDDPVFVARAIRSWHEDCGAGDCTST